MKSETIPIVPAIIKITFQSMNPKTVFSGTMPTATNIPADTSAMYGLYRGSSRSKMYVIANSAMANVCKAITSFPVLYSLFGPFCWFSFRGTIPALKGYGSAERN
jgi:hypothetical protein